MEYSPVLSYCTAGLEIGAAVWVWRGPGRKFILRTVSAILLFLAAYQLVEATLCTGLLNLDGSLLSRLAFIVVAWLPPTGLLLAAHLYPSQGRALHRLAYLMYLFCSALVIGILLQPNFVSTSVCLVVFARYTNPTPLYAVYGVYYQLGLLSLLVLSAVGVTQCDDRHQRLLLGQLLLGSLAFIFPALVTVSIIPIADKALPSILCHFALFLALFLIRLVLIERKWEPAGALETPVPTNPMGTAG